MNQANDDLFPYRKDFRAGRFAYVVPLILDRGRINLSSAGDDMSVDDCW